MSKQACVASGYQQAVTAHGELGKRHVFWSFCINGSRVLAYLETEVVSGLSLAMQLWLVGYSSGGEKSQQVTHRHILPVPGSIAQEHEF
jgi:hypothetical protein